MPLTCVNIQALDVRLLPSENQGQLRAFSGLKAHVLFLGWKLFPVPGKGVTGVHYRGEATLLGNGKQKTSSQVQVHRVKQNKDFPEDREP